MRFGTKSGICRLAVLVWLGVAACSSDAPSGPDVGMGGSGGSGSRFDGGPMGEQEGGLLDASEACRDYCDCYTTKCAVFVAIPTGEPCLAFCATFTQSQYDCRWGMCYYNSSGPVENNNNHCQHAVGIDQCLE